MAASSSRKRAGSGPPWDFSELGADDVIAACPWWDKGQEALQEDALVYIEGQ